MPFYTNYPVYPTDILNFTDYPTQVDDVDYVYDHLVNALRDELVAVQTELGTLPKGGYADVKTRLDDMSGGGGKSDLLLSWSDGDIVPYLTQTGIVYAIMAEFYFRGTDELGTPTEISFVVWVFDPVGVTTGSLKIYDVTNSNTIAEITGITEGGVGVFKIVTDSSLTNLPAGQAIFEVQGKIVGGTAPALHLASLSVSF